MIDPITQCWNWIGGKCFGGYGVIRIDNQQIGVHIFFYEYFKGKLPENQVPDYICSNKGCINPDHLEAVTQSENVRRSHQRFPKTHCINGHPYTDKNTYKVLKSGYRKCRICCKESKRKYLERQTN